MNLKEAFRFQNHIQRLMDEARDILAYPSNVVQVKTTLLRKKVMPEAEDEVVYSEPASPFSDRINQMVDFYLYLLDQRTVLARAIREAKAGMELDMDTETGLNSQRQSAAAVLRDMANLQSSEVLISGGGVGYRFNAEGNQVSYRCDARKVTTINFDRKKVRKLSAKLFAEADAASTRLDVALVTTQVDYQPPFGVNDTFAGIFETFCQDGG